MQAKTFIFTLKFVLINDQPIIFFSSIPVNYVFVNFARVKGSTAV